jgi:hypothetical protein
MALAVLLLLWYFFRPDRLFINKTVNEPPPQSLLLRPSMIPPRPSGMVILIAWLDMRGARVTDT